MDPAFLDTAIALLESVERRPEELRQIDNPSLCHGIAGQISIQRHIGTVARAHGRHWSGPSQHTVEQLLAMTDSDSLFGLRNNNVSGVQTDSPASSPARVALRSLSSPWAATGSPVRNICCAGGTHADCHRDVDVSARPGPRCSAR
ncbi:hypothetical protein [Streptomyces sp. Ac-502]|uniref:hypothetical protein n=1 Tax=Streptomyces sp. Ac-502 TaxID=3342801 RepID=UPI003862B272